MQFPEGSFVLITRKKPIGRHGLRSYGKVLPDPSWGSDKDLTRVEFTNGDIGVYPENMISSISPEEYETACVLEA